MNWYLCNVNGIPFWALADDDEQAMRCAIVNLAWLAQSRTIYGVERV